MDHFLKQLLKAHNMWFILDDFNNPCMDSWIMIKGKINRVHIEITGYIYKNRVNGCSVRTALRKEYI